MGFIYFLFGFAERSNYYQGASELGFLECRRAHSFLQSLYFNLLFSRVNESDHLDAAEQTDLPMPTRSASESLTMRRRNSSASNRSDAITDSTARVRKSKSSKSGHIPYMVLFPEKRNRFFQQPPPLSTVMPENAGF